ncbi:hypothetical protein A2773_00865 [Candidatus Gottesmanbacteria bacterium RIFCSPHIGHO2_01_FULL_39_10]|uniref:DUF5660 domain-containing protein n=1 Tax=Candidatus Gottesmanbacteria bacterium RIFCSPHIGHO2_01_FULL_39_10 TaxID=1798375 RepID=A0A1F5ZMK1_9BACT|nr:MAG: hypothetical protein A2773_00865 [Candidatus Gottesmanbacteria bacterium RIFCSPHIGHO2_01_FULL_39_10]
MAKVSVNKYPKNVWGEDNPEKIRQHTEDNQLKKAAGILNPGDLFSSFLGINKPSSETVKPEPKEEKISIPSNEVLIYSFRSRMETRSETPVDRETSQEIQELMKSLKSQIHLLEKSESNLDADIAKIKVDQIPQKSGIYYLRFFEWLLIVIKQLRAKVEEGRTWLNAFSGKKKKMGYWKMYKKHGTNFGLSHERTAATQSG